MCSTDLDNALRRKQHLNGNAAAHGHRPLHASKFHRKTMPCGSAADGRTARCHGHMQATH
jgi:hypothetical protein